MSADHLLTTKVVITWTNLSVASILAYLWLNQAIISLLAFLLIIDCFTWFTRAWINKEADSRTGIRWIISKSYLLFIPISIALTWKIADIDLSYMVTWTFSLLAFAELYSIISNIHEIRTGKKLPEYDAVSSVINAILKLIRKMVDSNIK